MSHHLAITHSSEWELTTAFTKLAMGAGNGNGNVASKVILCCFNLHYKQLILWSNVGELSWSWILKNNIQVQKEKENFVMAFLHPPLNGKLGIFMSLLCSDGKEIYKKSVLHVQCCFFAYWTFCCYDILVTITIIES